MFADQPLSERHKVYLSIAELRFIIDELKAVYRETRSERVLRLMTLTQLLLQQSALQQEITNLQQQVIDLQQQVNEKKQNLFPMRRSFGIVHRRGLAHTRHHNLMTLPCCAASGSGMSILPHAISSHTSIRKYLGNASTR